MNEKEEEILRSMLGILKRINKDLRFIEERVKRLETKTHMIGEKLEVAYTPKKQLE